MEKHAKILLIKIFHEVLFWGFGSVCYLYINYISYDNLSMALNKLYYGNSILLCVAVCHIINLIVFIIAFANKRNADSQKYKQFIIGKKTSAWKTHKFLVGITAVIVFVVLSFGFIYSVTQKTLPEAEHSYTQFVPSAFWGTDPAQDYKINVNDTFVFANATSTEFQYDPEQITGEDDFLFDIRYACNCNPAILRRIMQNEIKNVYKWISLSETETTQSEMDGIEYCYIRMTDFCGYEVLALYNKQYLHAFITLPQEQANIVSNEDDVLEKCFEFLKQQEISA